jgi:hypothetical protein
MISSQNSHILTLICNHIDLNRQTLLEYIVLKLTNPDIYINKDVEIYLLELIKLIIFYMDISLIRPIHLNPNIGIDSYHKQYSKNIEKFNDHINSIQSIIPSLYILRMKILNSKQPFEINLLWPIIDHYVKDFRKKRKYIKFENIFEQHNKKKRKNINESQMFKNINPLKKQKKKKIRTRRSNINDPTDIIYEEYDDSDDEKKEDDTFTL